MPTLSQRLGSFLSESRAEIFLHCRKDFPLPPPINRGGFYGVREEKIKSKNHKKPAFPLFPFSFFPRQPTATLSTASSAVEAPTKAFLLHQQMTSQPPHEPKSSPAIGAATARSSLSLCILSSSVLLLSSSATSSQPRHHFFHQNLRHLHGRPVTAASSPPQGRLPLHSAVCNCKVACRTSTYCSRSAINSSLTWAGLVMAQP